MHPFVCLWVAPAPLFACLFVSECLFLLFVSLFVVVLFLLFSVCVCFCLFVFFWRVFVFFCLHSLFCSVFVWSFVLTVVCLFVCLKVFLGPLLFMKTKQKNNNFFSIEVILLYGVYVYFLFSKVYSCFFVCLFVCF